MITLIKIRGKYLSNHLCSVYWSYFFIPSITLILLPILLISKINLKEKYSEKIKINGKASNITHKLFSQNISFDNYNFSIVSDDENDKKIIQEIIKLDIDWFKEEREIKENNIIKIINNNEKYNFELIIKNRENPIFYSFPLNTYLYLDPFKFPNNSYYKYFNDFKKFNKFIQLQSLFAQFLIKKKESFIRIKN